MLIDATHPEEIRVVVVDGKRLEEFDVELASKKQLKGNIYLAKVTRVEPSLQAAFVEYGGNRHGFLAFSEIHPDYYRIPVADREALLAEEAREAAAENAREDARDAAADRRSRGRRGAVDADFSPLAAEPAENGGAEDDEDHDAVGADAGTASEEAVADDEAGEAPWSAQPLEAGADRLASRETYDVVPEGAEAEPAEAAPETVAPFEESAETGFPGDDSDRSSAHPAPRISDDSSDAPEAPAQSVPETVRTDVSVEVLGGDEVEEDQPRRSPRALRSYKIQEVIKRRQVMLVQVTKEERGTKGAALTTYLSLAGRYCVLMPNTARGGGVSRKISNPADRKRLKSILEELDIPEGMAVIIRTAGAERSKAELKRDYEYLLRLWDEIRELTLKSSAPALVYEEANLIKRSIRDLYSRDIEDVIVDGEEGYKVAKSFMRTLTPSHAKRVQLYRDPMPLFHRYQVESQLDAIHNPIVQLKSGGYIVINSTEALVAIDVNSGRATRERNIEETAYKTNLEAAEEIARQLRLRDLAGLIVIDFIDMEEGRHNAAVERRLKEAMRNDRARIQIGRISPFGLLELSRQRMRPSLFETSTEICEHCRGTGHVRSTESTVLHVLRSIEDECLKSHNAEGLSIAVPTAVALYILNHKRKALAEIELRHGMRIFISGDDHLIPPEYRVERIKALAPGEQVRPPVSQVSAGPAPEEPEAQEPTDEPKAEAGEEPADDRSEADSGDDRRRGRRPRRRRRGRDRDQREPARETAAEPSQDVRRIEIAVGTPEDGGTDAAGAEVPGATAEERHAEETRRRRRRGRRGGRRRRRGEGAPGEAASSEAAESFAEGGPDEPAEAAEDYEPVPALDEAKSTGQPWEAAPAAGTSERPWSYRSRYERKDEPATEAIGSAVEEIQTEPEAAAEPEPAAEATTAAAKPAPVPEPVAAEAAADPAEEPAKPASPPRRGWWRRLAE
jgi:ribonuclease E